MELAFKNKSRSLLDLFSFTLLKRVFLYVLYIFYLKVSQHYEITFAILPLVFLIPSLSFKNRFYILLLFSCFDFGASYFFLNPYVVTFNPVLHYVESVPYYIKIILAFMFPAFMLIIYWLGMFHSFIRSYKSYYSLFFLSILLFLAVASVGYFSDKTDLLSITILSCLIYIFKKFWIIYLCGLVKKRSIFPSYNDAYSIIFPGPITRESFDITDYEVEKYKSLDRGLRLAAVFLFLHLLFNQMIYSFSDADSGYVLLRFLKFNSVQCAGTAGGISSMLAHLSISSRLLCIFIDQGMFGIIRHVFLDGVFFVVLGHLLGVRFTFPYSNFFKSKNFQSFLYNIFYYYSIIIFRLFVVEFYKLTLDLFKVRKKYFLSFATFFGVFAGGFIFHIWADALFLQVFYGKSLFNVWSFSYFSIYFGSLGLACTLSNLKFSNAFFCEWFRILFYFVFLIFIRFIFSRYFEQVPLLEKIYFLFR